MKTTLFTTTILFVLTTNLFAQSITIGEDGRVRCVDVPIWTTETVDGETYEVVDRELLVQRRDEGSDLTKVCVSNITDMSFMFFHRPFNQPIGGWVVSSVSSMQNMFSNSPFNPATQIQISLPQSTHVRLEVYPVTGRLVAVLIN